jgi:tetratricopeptide (TPR) repeat protein
MNTSTSNSNRNSKNNNNNEYAVLYSRKRYVAELSKGISFEKKGDFLEKLDRYELASRAYETGLQIEEKNLGKSHPLVLQLREKLLMKRSRNTFQRKDMTKLLDSFSHEKHANYLVKVGHKNKAISGYKYCLDIENRIIGENHPMVCQLIQQQQQQQQQQYNVEEEHVLLVAPPSCVV